MFSVYTSGSFEDHTCFETPYEPPGGPMAIETLRAQEHHPFDAARDSFAGLVAKLETEEARRMTHSDVERLIINDGTETLRLLFQGFLHSFGVGKTEHPVIGAEGGVRTHIRIVGRNIESIFGTVRIERTGYGQREISPVYPLDGHLNLPKEVYSHEVSRRVAEEAAKNSFNETAAAIERTTGASVPKRQVEELVVEAARDFDGFYKIMERDALKNATMSGEILVITADGKGVVMRKEDLRDATKKAASRRVQKLSSRLSKGEKRNAKRMAEVAAVYTIGPHARTAEQVIAGLRRIRLTDDGVKPPKPEHKRVWASLEKELEEVIDDAFKEGAQRDPERKKQWVALVDGNPTQLSAVKDCAERYDVEPFIVVDFIHVLEYLWDAGHELCGEGAEAEEWVLERALRVLHGEASLVAGGIRRSATMTSLPAEKRKAADDCADYLVKYAKLLRYDICLEKGYPIATGVIEGACRHLVKDRMELTGARWRLRRAEAVLKIRALRSSGDFDAYWVFHEQMECRRNHKAKYRGKIPEIIIPLWKPKDNSHRNLRLLK
jgi:hypothetical protein